MKWLAFVVALGAVLPAGMLLRRYPNLRSKCFVLVGILPYFLTSIQAMNMAVVPWPTWWGYVHGFEITIVDLVLLTLYVALPKRSGPLPFTLPFAFYFFAVLLSIFQAPVPLGAAFYLWQVARIFLAYLAIERACADERVPGILLTGLAIGLCFEAALTTWQHFALGMIQARGTFLHQNTLGFVTHFVVMPLFALMLAGRRGWQTSITLLAGGVIDVFTTSRGALGFGILGLVIVFGISALRSWTARKGLIAAAGMICIAAAVPVVIHSFDKRFSATPLSETYDEREAFNKAAGMMLHDHPMGIGANNYVYVGRFEGYSARAGVIPVEASRDAQVHNVYWLAAAETGYLGLIAFLILLLRPLVVAFKAGWRARDDDRGDLLLGLGVTLLVISLHSTVEWILFTSQVQYFFIITIGIIGALSQRVPYRSSATLRSDQIPTESPTLPIMSSDRLGTK